MSQDERKGRKIAGGWRTGERKGRGEREEEVEGG
jgi:hypothetical protein